MQTWQIIAIGLVVVIAAVAAWWLYERNRTRHLKTRFGPEYERRVSTLGRRRAESELLRTEARVHKMKARPLSASDRARFSEQWRLCQARFVDDPDLAVDDADRLLTNIMRAHGYSVEDPYERVTEIAAAYPRHAEAFHEANRVVIQKKRGDASTEDLRIAFRNFRALFDDALGGRDEELERAA